MSKLKKTDEIYILRRQLKEQEELIKKLYRRLNNELKQEKHEAKKTKTKEPTTEEIPDEKDGSKCPQCPKGKLIVSDLGFRVMTSCSDCKYKKVTKNG